MLNLRFFLRFFLCKSGPRNRRLVKQTQNVRQTLNHFDICVVTDICCVCVCTQHCEWPFKRHSRARHTGVTRTSSGRKRTTKCRTSIQKRAKRAATRSRLRKCDCLSLVALGLIHKGRGGRTVSNMDKSVQGGGTV